MLHGDDHYYDLRVAAASAAWLATAKHALAQPHISGVFVDKAGGFFNGAWTNAHTRMLDGLIEAAAAAGGKHLIFNDASVPGKAGQLFERWGANSDHDGLNVTQNLASLKTLTGAGSAGRIFSLARAGGASRGSAANASAEVCGAGLAAMLVAVASPDAAFFACETSFDVVEGWMLLDENPIYHRFLGAPLGEAVVGQGGLVTRAFEGAHVALNTSAFTIAGGRADLLNRGCVKWASGETTGTCP